MQWVKKMNEQDLEKRLSRLNLARTPDDFLERGLTHIASQQPANSFWQSRMPVVLASALVLSVSANVFQLVNSKDRIQALEAEQLAQCQTPAAAASPVVEPGFEFATFTNTVEPQGMC